MQKTCFSIIAFALFLGIITAPTTLSSVVFADAGEMRPLPEIKMPATAPVRIIIPSIGLDAPIQNVGKNEKGEMDVPSGKTRNVGWYKYGAKPGETGTAVLDAHVFAAFSELKYVEPGADIYITTESGQKVHFRVEKKQTYALANLSSQQLFTGMDESSMNLITCAGSLTADRSTYTHRLVVYTTLVND